MDGTGEAAKAPETDAETIARLTSERDAALNAEVAEDAAEHADTAAIVAPGDGTRPQDGAASPTAEGTGSAVVPPNPATGAALPTDANPPAPPTVLELLADARKTAQEGSPDATAESPHAFIEQLRDVSTQLQADGRLTTADQVSSTEAPALNATVVKVLGELVGKA